MLLLRFTTPSRWLNDVGQPRTLNEPGAIDLAGETFSLREGEEGLSLYSVSDREEAQVIAAIFALTQRTKPDKVSYLLVDESVFLSTGSFILNYDAPTDLPPDLSQRHCSQREFQDPQFRQLITQAILHALSDPQLAQVLSMTKAALVNFVHTHGLAQDPQLAPYISDHWIKALRMS